MRNDTHAVRQGLKEMGCPEKSRPASSALFQNPSRGTASAFRWPMLCTYSMFGLAF